MFSGIRPEKELLVRLKDVNRRNLLISFRDFTGEAVVVDIQYSKAYGDRKRLTLKLGSTNLVTRGKASVAGPMTELDGFRSMSRRDHREFCS